MFFGATQFKNRANVWGTIVAVYTLAFGVKGLQLVAGPGTVWIGPVFEGTALLLAVALASRQGTIRLRRARAQASPPPTGAAAQPTPNGSRPAEAVPAH